MPIENRNLEPGTKLVATYKKETYHALVVAGDAGKVLYQLTPHDGKEYKSPSSLGTAVTKKACNGWTFWSVDTGEAPAATTEPDAAAPESQDSEPAPEPPAATGFRRVPNQKGVDPGQVRLYCDACKNSFIVPDDKNPTTCPAGHSPS